MKALFLMLVMSVGVFAQSFVGVSNGNEYFIDKVERKADTVKFEGLVVLADEPTILVSLFLADCKKFTYSVIVGKEIGKPEKAEKPQMIFHAIEAACKPVKLSKFDI